MNLNLASRHIRDAKIQAYRHPQVAPPPHGFKGGLVLGDGEDDNKLRHTRYWKPVDAFVPDAVYQNRLDGSYVYAGPTYHHFGHVLAEMVHRIIPSKGMVKDPHWLLVTTPGYPRDSFDKLFDWLKPVYTFLEMKPARTTILNRDTEVSELLVVEQGSDFGGGPKPGYLDQLADYTHGRLDKLYGGYKTSTPVYVSRSAFTPAGGILGERYLEQALASEGFQIYHPEKHSFTEQMDRYRKAEALIFSEGSACHGVELLGTNALGRCVLLNRRAGHLDIFRKALEPRSEEFHAFSGNRYLGSVLSDPGSGKPMEHLGVSLFDFEALVDFLRSKDLAQLPNVSRRDYFAAAEIDLLAYLAAQAENDHFRDTGHLKGLLKAFNAARSG